MQDGPVDVGQQRMTGKKTLTVKVTHRGLRSLDAPVYKEGYRVTIMPSEPKSEKPSKSTPRKPQ